MGSQTNSIRALHSTLEIILISERHQRNMAGYKLTGEQFEGLRDKFIELDVDQSGTLSLSELLDGEFDMLEENGGEFTDNDKAAIKQLADPNGDGSITFYEFLKMMAEFNYNQEYTKASMRSMFLAFDADDSGSLSREELRRLWNNLVDNDGSSGIDLEEVINEVSVDEEDMITYEEFVNVVVPKMTEDE